MIDAPFADKVIIARSLAERCAVDASPAVQALVVPLQTAAAQLSDGLARRQDAMVAESTSYGQLQVQKLAAIEVVLVDPQRKSARDVLRNPAGLNDTLFDMVQMTTTADAAPTTQTQAVSRETMAKVDDQVGRFEALVKSEVEHRGLSVIIARRECIQTARS